MAGETVLVVEDEEDIQELIRYNLSKAAYKVSCVGSGEEALKSARSNPPDLMILDLMLPGVDGLEVCRRIKQESATSSVPIIMVTAKGEETDIVVGLELGADDYITKPFSLNVFLSRVKAVLRRHQSPVEQEQEVLSFPELKIHCGRHQVLVEDKSVDLTATEFNILKYLANRPGWVFTRLQIVEAIRGEDFAVTPRAIDFQIVGLRKKLGPAAGRIETVRGVGYRFKE